MAFNKHGLKEAVSSRQCLESAQSGDGPSPRQAVVCQVPCEVRLQEPAAYDQFGTHDFLQK